MRGSGSCGRVRQQTRARQLFNSAGWGRKPLAEAVPEPAGSRPVATLDEVYAPAAGHRAGRRSQLTNAFLVSPKEVHYLTYTYAPMYAEDGRDQRHLLRGFDVTAAEMQRRRGQAIDRLMARLSDLDDATEVARVAAEFAATEVGANAPVSVW